MEEDLRGVDETIGRGIMIYEFLVGFLCFGSYWHH